MSKKLAVVISGAVSLGSYEAGVMYEVLEAIARHNEKATSDDERIEIDVITGASAGGMTACILAQHLICGDQPLPNSLSPQDSYNSPLLNNPSLREPYNNPLYNAWVKEVDITKLLDVAVDEQKFSLLQTKVVEEIGERYLQDEPVMNEKHPAAAPQIYVGIAMSNLSGFNFSIKTDYARSSKEQTEGETKGTREFSYTRYKDQFFCVASRNESDDATLVEIDRETIRNPQKNPSIIWKEFRDTGRDTTWKELREVGLSSGAFPFAFKARKIERFGGLGKRKDRIGEYIYTDGGVFENEPIGMAKTLVENIDKLDSSSNRYYLYIAPGLRELSKNPFTQKEDADFLVVGVALLNSIFQQSRFQDWVMEDMDAPVFSITADDFKLIGDVFSAFGGFLEEKFRAYDYNIGRERARYELSDPAATSQLQDLVKVEVGSMPPIEWEVSCQIGGKNVKNWEEARIKLGELAQPRSKEGKPLDLENYQPAERDQFAELRELMKEVNVETQNKIIQQLNLRLESLIDLANEYLMRHHEVGNISSAPNIWTKINLKTREKIGVPLTKGVLMWAFKFWMERTILPQK